MLWRDGLRGGMKVQAARCRRMEEREELREKEQTTGVRCSSEWGEVQQW